MAVTTPEVDFVTRLDADVAGLTAGSNLFEGPARATGDGIPAGESVFCEPQPGRQPMAFLNSQTDEQRWPHVRVVVRSDRNDWTSGIARCREVRDSLHRHVFAGYVEWRALTSDWLPLGETDDNEHEFSMTFEAEETP